MPSNKARRYQKENHDEEQFGGAMIDEMIRGYAKGYLFTQMVFGCLFLFICGTFIFAVILALSILLVGNFVGHP
jgi:hypothetical protein